MTKSTQIAAAFAEDGLKGKDVLQFAKRSRERDLFRWTLGKLALKRFDAMLTCCSCCIEFLLTQPSLRCG